MRLRRKVKEVRKQRSKMMMTTMTRNQKKRRKKRTTERKRASLVLSSKRTLREQGPLKKPRKCLRRVSKTLGR